MSPAGVSPNPVDITANLFVGRLCPAQNHFDFAFFVVTRNRKRLLVSRFLLTFRQDLVEVRDDPVRMKVFDFLFARFIMEDDLQSGMDIGNVFQMLFDGVRMKRCLRKDLFVRAEKNDRATPAKRTNLLDGGCRFAAFITLRVLEPVTIDGRFHLDRQCVYNGRTNAV